MKLFKNAKRTLSLLLTVVMALTMMSVMSVSAEDTTTETETVSVYDRFTWSPLKGVTATAEKITTTSSVTNEAYAFEGTVPVTTTTYAIENVTNDDGTITSSKIRTKKTYVDNGDGTATETTEIRTVASTVENPVLANGTYFKFGVYSDRDDVSHGYHYATYLNPYINWDRGGQYGGGFEGPTNKEYHNQHAIMIENPDDDKYIKNVAASYYLTKNHMDGMQDTLMYRVQQYNEMALAFVAPENGVYTISGDISKVTTTGYTDSEEGNVKYFLIKIDEYGVEHVLTEAKKLPERDTAIDEIPDVKVALKAGEQLVLRTDNNLGFVCKLYLEDYLVTKWDYAEADDTDLTTDGTDNSTVTVNYGYENQAYMNVYGENYAIGDSNFETLWNVEAIRLSQTDINVVDATADFNKLYEGNKIVAQATTFCRPGYYGINNGPSLRYDAETGDIYASIAVDRITSANDTTAYYQYGTRFTFTVPEDGSVVLTGGTDIATKFENKERYGIIKAGTDTIEYRTDWSTQLNKDSYSIRNITYEVGELEAGDKIVLEIATDYTATTAWHKEYTTVNSVNVALTTKNSVADINGDFKGDATDTVYMRKFLLRTFEAADKSVFDVTGDGNADIRDLVKIKKLIAGIYE